VPIILYHLYLTDVEILLWIVGIFIASDPLAISDS